MRYTANTSRSWDCHLDLANDETVDLGVPSFQTNPAFVRKTGFFFGFPRLKIRQSKHVKLDMDLDIDFDGKSGVPKKNNVKKTSCKLFRLCLSNDLYLSTHQSIQSHAPHVKHLNGPNDVEIPYKTMVSPGCFIRLGEILRLPLYPRQTRMRRRSPGDELSECGECRG